MNISSWFLKDSDIRVHAYACDLAPCTANDSFSILFSFTSRLCNVFVGQGVVQRPAGGSADVADYWLKHFRFVPYTMMMMPFVRSHDIGHVRVRPEKAFTARFCPRIWRMARSRWMRRVAGYRNLLFAGLWSVAVRENENSARVLMYKIRNTQ